jgi:hypothetical protein
LWVLLVLIVAVAGGVLAFVLVNDSGGSGNGARSGASTAPSAKAATIADATSFDPQGDGEESPDLVPNAYDGNPSTSWSTEQYENDFPDGDKHGVGLALSLDGEYDVSKVVVDTEASGWGASIYVSDKDASALTTLADWGPARAEASDLDSSHTFDIHRVKGRSVLVWLTKLPQHDDGKHYVAVSEVTVA